MRIGMKRFAFVIHNENGLDARLAGMFIKGTIACSGDVRIMAGNKKGNGKMIFNVLSLHARKGDSVVVEIDGGREDEDAQRLMRFAEHNL